MNLNTKIIIALLAIIIIGGFYYSQSNQAETQTIEYPDIEDKVHVHSDFVLYLDGETYDLTGDEHQSKPGEVKHAHMHLHDNDDEVIHRHEEDITIADFVNSIGFILTDECITTNTGVDYCSDENNELQLYVNGERQSEISSYVNQEEDRILLFYGETNDPALPNLLDSVTDNSCIFSGTCPERGTAPAESCGLTCEL